VDIMARGYLWVLGSPTLYKLTMVTAIVIVALMLLVMFLIALGPWRSHKQRQRIKKVAEMKRGVSLADTAN